MRTISVTKLREKIYKSIEDVNVDSTPIMITNDNGKNVVLISEDD